VLRAFLNSFKVPDLRAKILFTLFIIAVYRFGSHVPVPVVDVSALRSQQSAGGFLDFINIFSGGALTRFSVFSLGIMPYITSSIIMQLLTVVIPKLTQWQEQGEAGTKKINQWTRYVTVVLALLQSTGLAFLFNNPEQLGLEQSIFPDGTFTVQNVLLIVLVMTAGTAMIMWLGELITQRGVGNGMSILIFTSVISTLPQEGGSILAVSGFKFAVVLLIGLGIIVSVVYMDQGQRRVPVQYAKRVVGRKVMGGTNTYLPLKVNQAGVIPIIFATSVMYFPVLIASVYQAAWFRTFVDRYVQNQRSLVYMGILATLIVFFSYFYTAIQFDPVRTADNLRKNGGFIPGIRPGPSTADYLNDILVRITLPGSLFLATIALIPTIVLAYWSLNQFPFGGTSILIAVGVALETMKQIESQLMMRHYEGFLR
jgi:preprotein translocase subunit SecY